MNWRAVRVLCACGLLASVGAPACGGSASDPGRSLAANGGNGARAGAGNSGGAPSGRAGMSGTAGASAPPAPVSCGKATCSGVVVPLMSSLAIPGCCADAATSHCGLDSSGLAMMAGPMFAEACQPLAQPGTADASCPMSPQVPVQDTGLDIQFPGCCRPDHTCGYQLDTIGGLIKLGLGCVDSAPFLNGEAPQPCGEMGAAGAAGSTGAGGAGGDGGAPAGAGDGGDRSSTAGVAGDSAGAGG